MSYELPQSQSDLVEYCLRKLGKPVVEINIDPVQANGRIQDALQFFQDYHFDGADLIYLKHQVNQNDVSRMYIDMSEASGTGTTNAGNTWIVSTRQDTFFLTEFASGLSVVQIGGETANVITVIDNYNMITDHTFGNTSIDVPITNLQAPDSILGINRIFPIASTNATVNMFDLRYQLRLHELYDFTSTSYINFVLTEQQLRTLDILFSGENPIRFNRSQNRLYIDFQWGQDICVGEYLIIECYKIIDPMAFPNVYNDRMLKKYATALIKKQWAQNMYKYSNIPLPGGVTIDGKSMYAEAAQEVDAIETEIVEDWQLPPIPFIIG